VAARQRTYQLCAGAGEPPMKSAVLPLTLNDIRLEQRSVSAFPRHHLVNLFPLRDSTPERHGAEPHVGGTPTVACSKESTRKRPRSSGAPQRSGFSALRKRYPTAVHPVLRTERSGRRHTSGVEIAVDLCRPSGLGCKSRCPWPEVLDGQHDESVVDTRFQRSRIAA